LNVNVLLINIIKIVKNDITLRPIKTNNPIRHRTVHPERFPARGRMNTNNGMNALNVLWSLLGVVTVQVGMGRAVNSLPAIDDLAKLWGELLICSVARCPEGISTDRWYSIIVEMCDTRWLLLMNEICVPTGCTAWLAETSWALLSHEIGPEDAYTWDARDMRDLRL
jgi:hypothetical protein